MLEWIRQQLCETIRKPSKKWHQNQKKKSWWHDLFFISELVLQFMLACRFLLFLLTCHFLRILQFPAFDLCDCHDVIFRKYHHFIASLKITCETELWRTKVTENLVVVTCEMWKVRMCILILFSISARLLSSEHFKSMRRQIQQPAQLLASFRNWENRPK